MAVACNPVNVKRVRRLYNIEGLQMRLNLLAGASWLSYAMIAAMLPDPTRYGRWTGCMTSWHMSRHACMSISDGDGGHRCA
jgi:hypothetical protein